ncbi:cytochrome P450 [Aspergillus pseudoustus]|uniref:Cytochrome P450 n=1 Tax=Aspergillus pseudoustus TaxID=1810923 RepID=A0ABR4I957_9EURO
MLATVLWTACSGLLVYALARLRFIRLKQYAHLPGPTTTLLWGHLKLVLGLVRKEPSKHYHYAIHDLIKSQADDTGLMFLDLRPASIPVAFVYSHELAEQITSVTPQFKYSVPKAPLQDLLGPVIGHKSFLLLSGEQWRDTRKMFNMAFAPNHLVTFIPAILDKVSIFMQTLDAHARSGNEFNLGERCTLLTLDVIGRVILNVDLNSQREKSEQHNLVRGFQELLDNLPFAPQLQWLLSPRKYRRRMGASTKIEASLQSIIQDKLDNLQASKDRKPERSDRSVLFLALESIDAQQNQETIQTAIDSIRTFLFAGYDTTSVLLQWALYELSRTPRALAALRAELDRVVGPNADPTATAAAIIATPAKLSELVYLSAVIRETLRLHPPAGTSRFVAPGPGTAENLTLQTPRGPLCVDGVMLYLIHFSIQRDRAVYGDSADAWVPERWLQQQGAGKGEGVPPASAWRPFERGPRGCIGQDLALLEARLVLAMAVRRYDFVKVGLGATVAQNSDEDGDVDEYGQYCSAEPLYDTFNLSSKPVDGTRMRVRFHWAEAS